MTDTFRIKELKKHFTDRDSFSQDELHDFYKEFEPDLKRSTLRWRVYELKEKDILRSVKRGWYTLKTKREWQPDITDDLKSLYESIQEEFPYLTICIWSTSWLLSFLHHLPVGYLTLIDTEKDTEEAVFNYVRSRYKIPVMLKPRDKEINTYINWNMDNLIIRTLISQSPLMEVDDIKIPKLEKIIIDLFSDKKLFKAFHGKELKGIYQTIFENYLINRSTLRRYASRRNKWDDFKRYIRTNLNNIVLE